MPWDDAVSELAKKITARASAQAVTLSIRNISSLTADDVTEFDRTLRSALRREGAHLVETGQAAIDVHIVISENSEQYIWVAEIQEGAARDVTIVPVARQKSKATPEKPGAVTLRRTRLMESERPILDVLVLPDPANQAERLIELEASGVNLFERNVAGSGAPPASFIRRSTAPVPHSLPWPRDLRGRLVLRGENRLDIYQPGTKCAASVENGLSVSCRDDAEPWPVIARGEGNISAQFTAGRNYFDGRLRTDDAREINLPPFFNAEIMPGPPMMWIASGIDGTTRLLGVDLQPLATWEEWGSEIVAIKSSCGGGRQILATRGGNPSEEDTLQAYEVSARGPVAVSEPLRFGGPVTALRESGDGSNAIVVFRDLTTERYEAALISVACGQ